MKGFYIFEEAFLKDAVTCLKLSNIEHTFKCEFGKTITEEVDLHALIEGTASKSRCNKEDSYDFEIGALISLMKICGRDKVTKACDKLYKDNNYKNALQETTENNEKLIEENNYLKYVISCRESAIESLENTRDLLINKNNELIEEKEKLQHEYNLCKNSENALKCSVDYLNKTIAKLNAAIYGYKEDLYKVAERCKELEEENEKLKLDCEKLQHGYNDMIFCGGRQNGKQYTFLKKLFKSISKDKVEAAYKEAYNTELPLWQKEVLNQMYSIHQKSKEKIELQGFHIEAKPLHNDQLDSLIEESIAVTRKSFDEWLYGPKTKRAEMWNNILACDCEHSKYVKVKKEDLEAFAKECNEKKIFSISGYEFHTQEFWFADDRCIFQIFRKPAGFICAHRVCFVFKDTIIDYLPPMRWDLFKKGRLAVKVKPNNYKEFYEACEKEIGKKPSTYFWDNVTISISKKDGNFEIFTMEDQKKTGRKIVNWEDVR